MLSILEWRAIPGIPRKIPEIFGRNPGILGPLPGILPAVPWKRWKIPDRHGKNPWILLTVRWNERANPGMLPTEVRKWRMIPGNGLAELKAAR